MRQFLIGVMTVCYATAGGAAVVAAWSLHPGAGWAMLALVLLFAAGAIQVNLSEAAKDEAESQPGVTAIRVEQMKRRVREGATEGDPAKLLDMRARCYSDPDAAKARWLGHDSCGDPAGILR
jgi:hypothetical protein